MHTMSTRFGIKIGHDNHLGKLALLRRTVLVEEYYGSFMALSFHDHSLTETQ
jgi:hypothetical protein